MKKVKGTVACLMAAVMTASAVSVTSCGKKNEDQISKDSPWYSLQRHDICENYAEETNTYETQFAGYSDGNLYYLTTGQYIIPDDVDFTTLNLEDYNFAMIDVYDTQGNLVKTINIEEDIDITPFLPEDQTCPNGIDVWNMKARFEDGKMKCIVDALLFPSWQTNKYYVTYDIETETVESIELAITFEEDAHVGDIAVGFSNNGSYSFEGYTVDTYTTHTTYAPVFISVTTPSGVKTDYDISQELPNLETSEASDFIYLGEGKALVGFLAGNRIDKYYYSMDLDSGTFTQYTEDTTWFSNYFSYCNVTYINGTGYVLTDCNGIKRIDFDTKEITEIFSYDSCNINRYDTRDLSVISITDDQILLTGIFTFYDGAGESTTRVSFYDLQRQDTNPNAGKTMIKAATLTEFDYTFCEAVCSFNETDEDSYIVLDSSYSLMQMYLEGKIRSYTDGFAIDGLEEQTELSNQLSIDLLSGDGPDIILDGASYYQLNNDDLLIDLSSDLNCDGLFTNIIDSAKVNGKLYQLPLTVGINGIVTHRSDIANGQYGFTFDQYQDFVNINCNGEEPVELGQIDFFITALSAMNGDFSDGDSINYDNDEFRELAQYVNDHVFNPIVAPEDEIAEYYDFSIDPTHPVGEYIEDISFGYLIGEYYNDNFTDITILGMPSSDARGPMVTVSSSVAVSAKTDNKDACIRFVQTLLSDEAQNSYGTLSSSIPIQIASFESSANTLLGEINNFISKNLELAATYGYIDPSLPSEEIPATVIDDFESVINSCSQVASLDPEIMIIVKEEMPAYFTGQKELDDVIAIINDRVSTFINERG